MTSRLVKVHVQRALMGNMERYAVPEDQVFVRWAEVLARQAFEVCVRIVDEEESLKLNCRYRGRSYAANVLSFPFVSHPGFFPRYLGDIVISAPTLAKEALSHGVSLSSYWARLFFHGLLHLQGYDHDSKESARVMENREAEVLALFGHEQSLVC